MTKVDMVVSVLIFVMAFKGYLNGARREFFSLAGVIGGVYAASHSAAGLALELTPYIKENIPVAVNPALVKLAAFIAVLTLVWGGISIVGKLFTGSDESILPSHFSRFGGYILGALKYFLIFSLIMTAIVQTPAISKKRVGRAIKRSTFYPYFESAGVALMNIDRASESRK